MLSLAGGEQHGYGIMQEASNAGGSLIGGFSDQACLDQSLDARRRYYRLTPLGRRVPDTECGGLQELVRIIRTNQSMVTE